MFEAEHERIAVLDPAGKNRKALEGVIRELSRLESRLVERRLAFTAAIDDLEDGGPDGAGVTRAVARRSSRTAKKAASSAQALRKMPSTRKALAEGRINEEHADAAAAAAERTSPEEVDEELSEIAEQIPSDLFAQRARSWAGAKERDAKRQSRHERQRSLREGKRWTDAEGMRWYLLGFDADTGKQVDKAIDAEIDRLWRSDGGREGRPDDVRSSAQRMVDAFAGMLTAAVAPTGKRPHPKYQVGVRVDSTRLRADNPTGTAEFVDGTAIPQTVLERICCDAEFAGMVFDGDGALLWQGRSKRVATDDQWKGLVVRDGGCVVCAEDPSRCEAHHLVPFAQPDSGPSDIDNFVLVCTREHHLIHDEGWSLVQENGEWLLRPPVDGRKRGSPPTWKAA